MDLSVRYSIPIINITAGCVAALTALREPLGTVWPALTKAMDLWHDLARARDARCEMLQRGAVQLRPLQTADVSRTRKLLRKYVNRSMDLADAALLRATECEVSEKSSPLIGKFSVSIASTDARVRCCFPASERRSHSTLPPSTSNV
jgi:hypothetical protein